MYIDMFRQMKKQLAQMSTWFDAAAASAQGRGFDPNVFLTMRLAPDQFALVKQVQIACDTAKFGAARVTGKEAPVQADDEQTLDALRARIAVVLDYLDGLGPQDFEGLAERTVTQPRWAGKVMSAHDYFVELVVPNFYFHLGHVYAIFRHGGVGLGKRDYLGALSQRPA